MKITRRIVTLVLAVVLSIGTFPITASAAGETMYGIGFVSGDSLRLRAKPDTGSQVLASAPKNDCVVVISKEGAWYRVSYNLTEGYMHEDYLDVLKQENAELGYGKVTGSGVNLRSGPATSYSKVVTAGKGETCYILGLNNGWYKVIYKEKICYIRSDFLELTEIPYENQASSNSPKFFRRGKSIGVAPSGSALSGGSGASASSTGSDILSEAKKHLGAPYLYGGATPKGFDCSGFVYYVLKQNGFAPSRMLSALIRQGSPVDKSDLRVGDVVFFANTYSQGISHVGIYAGGGQFIHAPNSRSTVSYSDLTTGYWADHYYGARRMV